MARGGSKADTNSRNGNTGANIGFEADLFLAADKLRKNLEPSDYKHVALGLIFLKYISEAFEVKREALLGSLKSVEVFAFISNKRAAPNR